MSEVLSLDAVRHTLIAQQEQSDALLQVINHVEGIKKETIEITQASERRINKRVDEVEKLSEDVMNRVFLEEGEATLIRSKVGTLSRDFAIEFFDIKRMNPSHNLFLSKMGQFRGAIYRRLKKEFNVTKYTNIRHVDFTKAMNYIDTIRFSHLKPYELRWTPKQLELLEVGW